MVIVEKARVSSNVTLPVSWPFNLPCVRQLCEVGLSFTEPITIFVGENGSGKSTLIEGLAEAYGLDVRGGHGNRVYASHEPKGPLGQILTCDLASVSSRSKVKKRAGFFLRSETAFGVFKFMSDHGVSGYGERHSETVSHGESYLQILEGRFREPGLFLLDEPEAPLSFQSCLVLIRVLVEAVQDGSQVICATHSPLLAAIPGASIMEVNDQGIKAVEWGDLSMVDHWRRYLQDPQTYLRHLLAD
jgi:predicted ATPase